MEIRGGERNPASGRSGAVGAAVPTAAHDDDLPAFGAVRPVDRHAAGVAVGAADRDVHMSQEFLVIVDGHIVLAIHVQLRIGDARPIATEADDVDEEITEAVPLMVAIAQPAAGEDQPAQALEYGIAIPENAVLRLAEGLVGENDVLGVVGLSTEKAHRLDDGKARGLRGGLGGAGGTKRPCAADGETRMDEVDELLPRPFGAGLEFHHDTRSTGDGAEPQGDQETGGFDPDHVSRGRGGLRGREDEADAVERGEELARGRRRVVFAGQIFPGREVVHEATI